jgi:hypothetical protein
VALTAKTLPPAVNKWPVGPMVVPAWKMLESEYKQSIE